MDFFLLALSTADYFITMASVEDEKDIMEFIDQEWSKNHILAVNKELFEWPWQTIFIIG